MGNVVSLVVNNQLITNILNEDFFSSSYRYHKLNSFLSFSTNVVLWLPKTLDANWVYPQTPSLQVKPALEGFPNEQSNPASHLGSATSQHSPFFARRGFC